MYCKLINVFFFLGWECPNTNALHGTTQTCRRNNNMISIFSYLFNFTLMLPKQVDPSKG